MVNTALTSSMTTRRLQLDPRAFGRRQPFASGAPVASSQGISDDFKLFALTWLAGFLTVSIFLA
jgi:hypothetical protein